MVALMSFKPRERRFCETVAGTYLSNLLETSGERKREMLPKGFFLEVLQKKTTYIFFIRGKKTITNWQLNCIKEKVNFSGQFASFYTCTQIST